MYELIKNVVKKIVPASLLVKNEKLLRNAVASQYKGDAYECTVCNFKMSSFIKLQNKDLLCPSCGCLGRARRLLTIVEDDLTGKVLHFSPPRPLRERFNRLPDIEYITTDFAGEFDSDLKLDITNIDQPVHSYNRIICYHVLEHIEDDITAMKELYLILKTGGKIYIQTPFKSGEMYEDLTITSKADRLKYYGQDDHVRIYSVSALRNRLELAGFSVEPLTFVESLDNYHGFKVEETILVASK